MSLERIPAPQNADTYEKWGYAPAVKVSGQLVFISGQVGMSNAGEVVSDPEAQITQAFENLKAVLAAAGCGFADLVEITTFHVDMHAHVEVLQRVKARYMPPPYPAWTAIGASDLAVPGLLFEIRAVARVPE